jgi:glyceraldehyde 3-phosphate dehydrogenase
MPTRFAINGLGRIGRALVRVAREHPEIELVAANDQADPLSIARLLRHDTIHGRFPGTVEVEDGGLRIDGRALRLFRQSVPGEIPWHETPGGPPEVVIEATGRFRARASAAGHLAHGVERVIVSATAAGVDATFCMGINEGTYDPARHRVVSNASCTTNCLAAAIVVPLRSFGVEQALMNTVHCYTNSQNLVDMAHADPRRARAAGSNIIPTTSDAIDSIGLVLPALEGRVEGLAMRVPIAAGSLVDLTVVLTRPATIEAMAAAYRKAASGELAGILGATDEALVSSDFIGEKHSAVVDLPLLQRAGDRLFRIVAWYDNEWGYTNRLADLVAYLGTHSAGGMA